MKKRGQITMFMILGIVLLTVFGFLFYASSILQGSREADIKRSQISDTRKTSVTFYIESVITESFKECLHLVGEQGGRIYDDSFFPDGDQYGNSKYNPPSYIRYPEHQPIGIGIRSGIVKGNDGVNMYRAREGNTLVIEDTYSRGSVGANYIYGLNAPLPPMDSDGGNDSIEKQLSDCTRRRFVKKFDIEPFLDMNYKIEVLQPEPNVTVSINNEDISVQTYFPVKIGTGGTEIITKDYFYKLNFKFKLLYGFIRDIIKEDMYTDVNIVTLNTTNYIVTREEARDVDPYTELKYDVINVTDRTFELDNKPFVFRFIRENRAPNANTVDFEKHPFYIYEDPDIVLNCPNYLTGHGLVDPDEDDLYAKQQGITDLGWYEFSGYCPPLYDENCGNVYSPGRTQIEKCHVCCAPGRPMVAFITDYGGALDLKPFSGRKVQCRPPDALYSGKCCGPSECWEPIECSTYIKCMPGTQRQGDTCGPHTNRRETCCTKGEYIKRCKTDCGECSIETDELYIPLNVQDDCWGC